MVVPQASVDGDAVVLGGRPPVFGPSSIVRYTRTMNRTESTVYIPIKPSNVNSVLPADTVFEYPSEVRISP